MKSHNSLNRISIERKAQIDEARADIERAERRLNGARTRG
jgi:hypothetical protein